MRRYKDKRTNIRKLFFDWLHTHGLNWIDSPRTSFLVVGIMLSGGLMIYSIDLHEIKAGPLPRLLLFLLSVSLIYLGGIIHLSTRRDNIKAFGSLALTKIRETLKIFRIPLIMRTLSTRLRIKKAPGTKLLSVVEFLYSPKTVEEVFKPIIADWRTEYFDALKQNRTIKAHWISARYKYQFILSMGMSKVYSLFRSILSARK